MAFEILLDYRVHDDIDEAIEFYNTKSVKVAVKFFKRIQECYSSLTKNPFFEIRYADYRCLPIKDFPFMFHFTVNERENVVRIHALINTSKNPETAWL